MIEVLSGGSELAKQVTTDSGLSITSSKNSRELG